LNALIAPTPRDLGDGLVDDLDGAFGDLVHGVALRMTGNAHDAEEIAQDAFENAYKALRRYPAQRVRALRLRPWLAQIAVNAARTRLRKKRLPTRALDDAPELRAARDAPPAETWQALLSELPERYRAAVILRYVEDLSYEDVAEALGQPVGTVKTNVHRAMQLLRAALDERG
jgi:RNA polymerase sigma-70 factor (ECF subfamily)